MTGPRVTRWLTHARWPLVVCAVAILLTLPAIPTGFVVDDYVHRAILVRLPEFQVRPLDMFAFVGVSDGADSIRRVSLPWWAAPDLKLAFWRPLTALTHELDYALWPDSPALMHAHSIAWYALLVWIVSRLFARLSESSLAAGLAAFVYAVSPTHAVPVFFLANRNALIGTCFSVAALLWHHRWRRDTSPRAGIAAPLALLAGLLANEGAVAATAYLFAYALFLDRASPRTRAVSLLPYLTVVAGWRLLYQQLGYGAASSAAYIDPLASSLKFLQAVWERAPLLALAEFLGPPSDWWRIVSPATHTVWLIGAVVLLAALFVVLWPLLARDRAIRFWGLGTLLSLLPACATFPMDRLLLYSEVGGAAVIGSFIAAVASQMPAPSGARVRALATRITYDVLIALHVIAAPIWLPISITMTAGSFANLTRGVEELARRDDLTGKLTVLVDDVMGSGAYFATLRALEGRPPVERLLVLSPGEDRFDTILLSRPSPTTLVMQIEGTYEWFLDRDSAHPFRVGDRVPLGRVTVEILATTPDGRPTRVGFDFDVPLEDSSLAWFGRLEPVSSNPLPANGHHPSWLPPPVGRTVSAR